MWSVHTTSAFADTKLSHCMDTSKNAGGLMGMAGAPGRTGRVKEKQKVMDNNWEEKKNTIINCGIKKANSEMGRERTAKANMLLKPEWWMDLNLVNSRNPLEQQLIEWREYWFAMFDLPKIPPLSLSKSGPFIAVWWEWENALCSKFSVFTVLRCVRKKGDKCVRLAGKTCGLPSAVGHFSFVQYCSDTNVLPMESV